MPAGAGGDDVPFFAEEDAHAIDIPVEDLSQEAGSGDLDLGDESFFAADPPHEEPSPVWRAEPPRARGPSSTAGRGRPGGGDRSGRGNTYAAADAQLIQPADLLAERAVLAACMSEPDAVPLAMSSMQSDDFYDQRHAEIFRAMTRLAMQNIATDVVSVFGELERTLKDKNPVQLGYLFEIGRDVGSATAIEHYALNLSKLARARRLLAATHKVQQKGYERGLDPDELVAIVEREIGGALKETVRGGPQHIAQLVGDVYSGVLDARERGGEAVGTSTGFRDIDKWHLGLHGTDLIILAARPAMGKSAFALNLATNVAQERRGRGPDAPRNRVAFFSLEMGREQLVLRLLSARSRIGLTQLRKGDVSPEDESVLRQTAAEFAEMDLFIDDTAGLSTVDLRSRCKRLEMGGPLTLVVVDYLQLMKGTGGAKQSREQEVAEISRSLKGLAKEMHCTVLALSQLNRSLEKRDDKNRKPQMSDLRESGSIEQDADIIWFIHREHYYKPEAPEHEAELVVAKQRAGMTGTIKLHFDGALTRFSNLDDRVDDEYAYGR